MPKYNVSLDLLLPVLLEIEADSDSDAVEKAYEMRRRDLLRLANTEEDGIGIVDDSVTVDEA